MVELLDISISARKPKPGKILTARQFEDGSVEVRPPNGVRIRQRPAICTSCDGVRIDSPFGKEAVRAGANGLCVSCFRREETERAEAIALERAERQRRGQTPAQRRYVAQVLATPVWRDRQKIVEIYAEARRKTDQTGIKHEVDHIYPIQSEHACGLHVHQNLQILDKRRNRSKKNAFPLFDSPCLW